jgi:hypothetical protein
VLQCVSCSLQNRLYTREKNRPKNQGCVVSQIGSHHHPLDVVECLPRPFPPIRPGLASPRIRPASPKVSLSARAQCRKSLRKQNQKLYHAVTKWTAHTLKVDMNCRNRDDPRIGRQVGQIIGAYFHRIHLVGIDVHDIFYHRYRESTRATPGGRPKDEDRSIHGSVQHQLPIVFRRFQQPSASFTHPFGRHVSTRLTLC